MAVGRLGCRRWDWGQSHGSVPARSRTELRTIHTGLLMMMMMMRRRRRRSCYSSPPNFAKLLWKCFCLRSRDPSSKKANLLHPGANQLNLIPYSNLVNLEKKNGGLNAQRPRNPKETKQGSACSRIASCSKAQIYCNKQTVSLQAGLLSLEKLFLEFPEDLQLGIY